MPPSGTGGRRSPSSAPRPAAGYGSKSSRRSSSRKVGRESCVGREHLLGAVDPGQHERGCDARAVRAEDVGVEPIAEEQGMVRPNRSTAASKIARSGLPATIGRRPTAVCTADTSVPLPGAVPRACGIVQSVFVATHGMPGRRRRARSAKAASARSVQRDARVEALDDGRRRVVGRARHAEAGASTTGRQPLSPDDEDRRARPARDPRAARSPPAGR